MGRLSNGGKPDTVETELGPGLVADDQVPDVGRVKGAAQDPNAHAGQSPHSSS